MSKHNNTHDTFPSDLGRLLTQPRLFFNSFPNGKRSVWVALLVLFSVSVASLRPSNSSIESFFNEPTMDTFSNTTTLPSDPLNLALPTDFSSLPPVELENTNSSSIDQGMMNVLIAIVKVLFIWTVIAVVLAEVTLFNGHKPRWKDNLQLAVWATVPLAISAVLQLGYATIGGQGSEPGVSLLLRYYENYPSFPHPIQELLHSATLQFHLFNLWTLTLLWYGGRHRLMGKSWAVLITLTALILIAVLVPVLVPSAFTLPALEEVFP